MSQKRGLFELFEDQCQDTMSLRGLSAANPAAQTGSQVASTNPAALPNQPYRAASSRIARRKATGTGNPPTGGGAGGAGAGVAQPTQRASGNGMLSVYTVLALLVCIAAVHSVGLQTPAQDDWSVEARHFVSIPNRTRYFEETIVSILANAINGDSVKNRDWKGQFEYTWNVWFTQNIFNEYQSDNAAKGLLTTLRKEHEDKLGMHSWTVFWLICACWSVLVILKPILEQSFTDRQRNIWARALFFCVSFGLCMELLISCTRDDTTNTKVVSILHTISVGLQANLGILLYNPLLFAIASLLQVVLIGKDCFLAACADWTGLSRLSIMRFCVFCLRYTFSQFGIHATLNLFFEKGYSVIQMIIAVILILCKCWCTKFLEFATPWITNATVPVPDFVTQVLQKVKGVMPGIKNFFASASKSAAQVMPTININLMPANGAPGVAVAPKMTKGEEKWLYCIVYAFDLWTFYDIIMLLETLVIQDIKLDFLIEWSTCLWVGLVCMLTIPRLEGKYLCFVAFVCNILFGIYINLQAQMQLQNEAVLTNAFNKFDNIAKK
jgi:hypothetical protein